MQLFGWAVLPGSQSPLTAGLFLLRLQKGLTAVEGYESQSPLTAGLFLPSGSLLISSGTPIRRNPL